jgi:molybdopterin molybdotransferase
VIDQARPLMRTESIPVEEATGRVLAEDVLAGRDLPPFDRVMMDGFAVRAAEIRDAPVSLPVMGEVAAGASADQPLAPGTARAIMTGAPLPPGADAVVPVEWTSPVEVPPGVPGATEGVRIERALPAGKHVAPQGQDLAAGQPIARAGSRIGPLGLSLLVSSGAGTVSVRARPRVALLTSGDELVAPGETLRRGQIHESNGPALKSLFERLDVEVVPLGVAKDTREDLAALVERALTCDVVVLTGGSSVGRYDFSAEVVESFGARRHFDRLSVKPGKPTLFYTRGDTLVFCLPGNPVAALMTGRVLVCPALHRLAGHEVRRWTPVTRSLASPVRRNAVRDLLIPVHEEGDTVVFDGWHGSGDLVSLNRADAFAFVARGDGHAEAGTTADVFPLTRTVSW